MSAASHSLVVLLAQAGTPVWAALLTIAAVDALEVEEVQTIKSATRKMAAGAAYQVRGVAFGIGGAVATGEKPTFVGFLSDMVPGLRTRNAYRAARTNCSGRS